MKRDFLSVLDITRDELDELFLIADELRRDDTFRPFGGHSAALIFQKPSLRTRVSFEVGIAQLGGHSILLTQEAIGIGERENAGDIARLLSRYTSLLIARLYDHAILEELARTATIPVINALTDLSHPCQILADVYTLRQHKKLREGMKVVFVGDGNNVAHSWLEMSELFPMQFVLACPAGYEPRASILRRAVSSGVSEVAVVHDPVAAARDADVLYTDVWASMGQESEQERRAKAFAGFQVNSAILSVAKPDAVVMHCLPAHRGQEITGDVLEGPHSIVLDEAENRLHMQKALLVKLLGAEAGLPLLRKSRKTPVTT